MDHPNLPRDKSDYKSVLDNFTAEQKVVFSELENERLDILNTEVKRIVNYIKENSESLNQKDQYENLLRRHQEIEVRIRSLTSSSESVT